MNMSTTANTNTPREVASLVTETIQERSFLNLPKSWAATMSTLLVLILLSPASASAAKISELGETGIIEQALRFFTFRDPSVRYALAGSMLLGITCGLLGSFIVVRKMALVGDALSHAVLPGVAIGFLWNMSKDPVAIFIGATIAG